MSFAIITESTGNLPTQLANEHSITVIPFYYFLDGREMTCDNTEAFAAKSYYDAIRKGAQVNTAQINPQRYMDTMEPYLQQGKDVLFVGLSSGISGSFASAGIARQELLEKYPDRDIRLIDSLGAGLGEGMLALRAANCRANGMDLEETFRRISKFRDRMYQVFIVDDLMHLRRTGRLSNVSALVGYILGIKPLLKGNEHGKIVAFGKICGRKASIHAMAEKYFILADRPELQTVGISHAACPEDAAYLMELISNKMPPKEFLLVEHEPVTGSHIGPGALALFFGGKDEVRTK